MSLTRELCAIDAGVVTAENERVFERIGRELPLRVHRFASGRTFNGWVVPEAWSVKRSLLKKDGRVIDDASKHHLGVAMQSRSFQGEVELAELRQHLVSHALLPTARMFHWQWQYRPWIADWALCVPHELVEQLEPGRYEVDLVCEQSAGEMLIGECVLPGRSERCIVFNAHTCHRGQANDGFAAVAVLIELFKWLQSQDLRWTYRLVLGPEHLGSVFYLSEKTKQEIASLVAAVFLDMPGTPETPLRIASSFRGSQRIDLAICNAARHLAGSWTRVGWREGAGNDETVWEAPGWEVPCVEVSRARQTLHPFPEYHTSLDTVDRLDAELVKETLRVLQQAVICLEGDVTIRRCFDGLICLSNPQYGLYLERRDPAIDKKELNACTERWGHLLDSLLRYFDGTMSVLDIAEKHELPFAELLHYIQRFEAKGLVSLHSREIERLEPSLSRERMGRTVMDALSDLAINGRSDRGSGHVRRVGVRA